MSAELQAETAAVTDDEKASQDVEPITSHSPSQNSALLHNQDSFLLELENSEQLQCSNKVTTSKFAHTQIMKAVKDVPAPKLCSHTEWEESNVVSPVEELQQRLVKHASIIPPEVVEDSGKIMH